MQLKPRHRRIVLAVVCGLLVLTAVAGWQLYTFLLPFPEKFRRSKPALDAYAARVRDLGPSSLANPPSRIGYFNVIKAEPLPHGFVIQSDYGNPFDWDGLAYSTAPLPEYDHGVTGEVKQVFTPLDGNWYMVFRP